MTDQQEQQMDPTMQKDHRAASGCNHTAAFHANTSVSNPKLLLIEWCFYTGTTPVRYTRIRYQIDTQF